MEPLITVIIETPKASAQKFAYDPNMGLFKLKKLLPLGMVFPYDFGFIPGTKGEDGDPLDVVVLSEFKSFPGCAMECRLIGAIKATQIKDKKRIRNDRYIAIPEASKQYSEIKMLKDLPGNTMHELELFFINYTALDHKDFKPLALLNKREAFALISDSLQENK